MLEHDRAVAVDRQRAEVQLDIALGEVETELRRDRQFLRDPRVALEHGVTARRIDDVKPDPDRPAPHEQRRLIRCDQDTLAECLPERRGDPVEEIPLGGGQPGHHPRR